MHRIKMGKLSDLPPGTVLEKQVLARRVAVVNDRGNIFGIESECKHMRASLATGGVKDGRLVCRWHGWQYDLETGECLTVAGFKLRKYEIEIYGDEIFILIS
jgi:nitrite reductase/ring-hydroxylating ferredoxin subunit